ncbi:MAG: hypothetical protein AAGA62_16250, partial [Bacteroidota bacterium]
MRFIFLALLAVFFSSCITPKKVEVLRNAYDSYIEKLEKDVALQRDSMIQLTIDVERLRGGNQSLLSIHQRMLEHLGEKEDELDEVRSNLSSTSTELSSQLVEAKTQLNKSTAAYDTLLKQQTVIIEEYQKGVAKAMAVLTGSLDGKIPDEGFFLTDRAGEVILSVQEDLLFKSRTNDRLTEQAEFVLRAVMDALQSDPLLKLTVVGHTDNQPNPRRNANNWEYAALRATFLAEELADT